MRAGGVVLVLHLEGNFVVRLSNYIGQGHARRIVAKSAKWQNISHLGEVGIVARYFGHMAANLQVEKCCSRGNLRRAKMLQTPFATYVTISLKEVNV